MMLTRNIALLAARLSGVKRWSYSLAILLAVLVLQKFLLTIDWPFPYQPFGITVPLIYFAFGFAPGNAYVLVGCVALVLVNPLLDHNFYSVSIGFLIGCLHGFFSGWLIHRLQRAHADLEVMHQRRTEELESLVKDRTDEIDRKTEELQAFTYSLSHDLRAPIRAINGAAAILLEESEAQLGTEARSRLEKITAHSQQMGELMDALLALAKLNQKPLDLQIVCNEVIVRQLVQDLAPDGTTRRLDFRIGPLPDSLGEPALIRQVWENLLSNAIKFTSRTVEALIEIGYDPVSGAYEVRDNGIGFDMQFAEKAFKPFERIHEVGAFSGTGVGLAIAQRVVQRYGCRIWCESAPGKGAVFRFTLPPSSPSGGA